MSNEANDKAFSPATVLAVVLSFAGNVINAFGYVMQKMGHLRVSRGRVAAKQRVLRLRYKHDIQKRRIGPEEMETAEELCNVADKHTFLTEPIWVIGFGLYMIGSLMHVAALGFGSQALLTPMEGVTLAANAVLAPIFLNERLKTTDSIGTTVIIVGITVTVIFGPHSSITYNAQDMLRMLSESAFLAWTLITTFFTVVVFAVIVYHEQKNKQEGIIMNGDLSRPGARLIVFGYVWIAGIFSSWTMLTAKQVAELTETTLSGDNQFEEATPFVILLTFLAMNFLMEYWKQKALASFSALIVVPLFQVFLVLLSVVGGAIYFREFVGMDAWRILMFCFGLGILCVGIFVLSMTPKRGRSLFTVILVVVVAQKLLRTVRRRKARRESSSDSVDGDADEESTFSPLLPPVRHHEGSPSWLARSNRDGSPRSNVPTLCLPHTVEVHD